MGYENTIWDTKSFTNDMIEQFFMKQRFERITYDAAISGDNAARELFIQNHYNLIDPRQEDKLFKQLCLSGDIKLTNAENNKFPWLTTPEPKMIQVQSGPKLPIEIPKSRLFSFEEKMKATKTEN